ncbi:hypothetical protein ACGFZS_46855 [Streptomyces sp. NPDC048288]
MNRLLARLRALIAYAGQCNRCGTWFDDWNGGTCDSCKDLPNAF